jgi:hypothetical protein
MDSKDIDRVVGVGCIVLFFLAGFASVKIIFTDLRPRTIYNETHIQQDIKVDRRTNCWFMGRNCGGRSE